MPSESTCGVVYNARDMDLLALAVPFFLLAFLIELVIDRVRGTGYIRASDAINSMSAGSLMTTIGYFTGLIPAAMLPSITPPWVSCTGQLR